MMMISMPVKAQDRFDASDAIGIGLGILDAFTGPDRGYGNNYRSPYQQPGGYYNTYDPYSYNPYYQTRTPYRYNYDYNYDYDDEGYYEQTPYGPVYHHHHD
jgi:hemolysin activation/secretion protein